MIIIPSILCCKVHFINEIYRVDLLRPVLLIYAVFMIIDFCRSIEKHQFALKGGTISLTLQASIVQVSTHFHPIFKTSIEGEQISLDEVDRIDPSLD
jgi:hypothetical protein